MELMRHTDLRLTMNVYADPSILNTAGAGGFFPGCKFANTMICRCRLSR